MEGFPAGGLSGLLPPGTGGSRSPFPGALPCARRSGPWRGAGGARASGREEGEAGPRLGGAARSPCPSSRSAGAAQKQPGSRAQRARRGERARPDSEAERRQDVRQQSDGGQAQGVGAPGGPSAPAGQQRLRPVGAPARLGRAASAAPHVAASGRLKPEPTGSAPTELAGLPAQLSPNPPFPLRHRDGRGLPPPPPAASRVPLSCGPEEPRAGPGRALPFAGRGGTSPFPVTRTPRRKGRDEARRFLCRLPRLDLRLPGHSRAAACPDAARGLPGAGPGRFGTPRPGKSLREGEAAAPRAVGRARLRGRDQEAGAAAGSETPAPGKVGGAAADSPAQPLCFPPAVEPRWPEPDPRAPPSSPSPFRRLRCPATPGTTPPGLGSSGRRSPRRAVLSGASSRARRLGCCSSRPPSWSRELT